MSGFGLITAETTGLLGLKCDPSIPKERRAEVMSGAAMVRPEGVEGLRNWKARDLADPMNVLFIKTDPAQNAPRGGSSSWTFGAPAVKTSAGYRVMERRGLIDINYQPHPAITPDGFYGGVMPNSVAALLVATSGHDSQDTVAFVPGGPLVAHHQHNAPTHSRWLWDIDDRGRIDTTMGAGIHSVLRVRPYTEGFCGSYANPNATSSGPTVPRNMAYINGTQSGGDNTGYFPATFASYEALMSHEMFGPLRPATALHTLAITRDGRRLVEGALDCEARWTRGDPEHDAPLEIRDEFEPPVSNAPFHYRVWCMTDKATPHPSSCGFRPHLRRWHAESPVALKPPCKADIPPGEVVDPVRSYAVAPATYTPGTYQSTGVRFIGRPNILGGAA